MGRHSHKPPALTAVTCYLFETSPTRYFFGGQLQLAAGFLQPVHTPLLISLPHLLQGEHPQTWHMFFSFV